VGEVKEGIMSLVTAVPQQRPIDPCMSMILVAMASIHACRSEGCWDPEFFSLNRHWLLEQFIRTGITGTKRDVAFLRNGYHCGAFTIFLHPLVINYLARQPDKDEYLNNLVTHVQSWSARTKPDIRGLNEVHSFLNQVYTYLSNPTDALGYFMLE
jgi:hypothetical protein